MNNLKKTIFKKPSFERAINSVSGGGHRRCASLVKFKF